MNLDEMKWSDTAHITNMQDRLLVVEAIATGQILLESNDTATTKYFLNLDSDSPIMDKEYIFVFRALINNVLIYNNNSIGTLIKFNNGEYTFKLSDGKIVKYPDVKPEGEMVVKTFLFDTTAKYNKFRTSIQLKFNTTLPNIIMNESATADLKNLARAAARKFSAGTGPDKNPHPQDSFQGKVWQQSFNKAMSKLPQPEPGLITEARGNSLILVDFQPDYASAYDYDDAIGQAIAYINKKQPSVTAFFNGADVGSDDTPDEVMWHYMEHGLNEDLAHLFTFKEKSFAWLRQWMDTGIDHALIIKVIRYIVMNDLRDSREIEDEAWLKLVGEDFEYYDDREMNIYLPDINIATLKTLSGSLLGGGGKHECLKELQLLMNAFNIKYKLVSDWIY